MASSGGLEETPYNHSKPYNIVNGGTWQTTRRSDSIAFTHTLSEPAIDFGYVYTKVIRLTKGKPQMTIAHGWKNTGKTPIRTNVYNHNFMTLDKQPPGPDYVITFPFEPQRVQRGARPDSRRGSGTGCSRRRPARARRSRAQSPEWFPLRSAADAGTRSGAG